MVPKIGYLGRKTNESALVAPAHRRGYATLAGPPASKRAEAARDVGLPVPPESRGQGMIVGYDEALR